MLARHQPQCWCHFLFKCSPSNLIRGFPLFPEIDQFSLCKGKNFPLVKKTYSLWNEQHKKQARRSLWFIYELSLHTGCFPNTREASFPNYSRATALANFLKQKVQAHSITGVIRILGRLFQWSKYRNRFQPLITSPEHAAGWSWLKSKFLPLTIFQKACPALGTGCHLKKKSYSIF